MELKSIKYLIKLFSVLLFFLIVLIPKQAFADETVKLDKKSLSIYVSTSKTLHVLNTKEKIKWKSSDTDIVKVDKNGKIKAINIGSANVTATIGKKVLLCRIKVLKLTESKAVELVTNYVKNNEEFMPMYIEYEYMDGDCYIIHSYDFYQVDDYTGMTSTYNWYNIDMYTGEITSMFE